MKDTGWTPMSGDFESPGVIDPELITGYGVDPKPAAPVTGDVQALVDAVLQALPTNNVGSGVVMFPRLEKACLALRAALKGE